jgi:hypothetical protein
MAKVLAGNRAKIYVDNQLVGIFESCSYGSNLAVEPIHILGSSLPVEITPTHYEAVRISCSGFRVVGNGPYVLPKFPKVQDILNLQGVTITIVDRQTGETIMSAYGCIPTSYNTAPSARATTRLNVEYIGLRIDDEGSGPQNDPGATQLP